MEELEEAEVLWPDNCGGDGGRKTAAVAPATTTLGVKTPSRAHGSAHSWAAGLASGLQHADEYADVDDDDDNGGGGGVIPPHVIVARRAAVGDKMAFSVCVGNGRTLKGRDLRRVRNSILKMTGFLEIGSKELAIL
ncbi:uncharacterized protein LOC141830468 [Curcuma longa]|uniref:uncharacterized protein LOC141830468 n=1 Tax=Curcuma longa TaxID=136217 RepID=UPI003D9E9547